MLALTLSKIGVTFPDVWNMSPREAYALADELVAALPSDSDELSTATLLEV